MSLHPAVKKIDDHIGQRADKHYKTTLFRADTLLLGLNCLEPGQIQSPHAHADQDKFYFVTAGTGTFFIGDDEITVGPGHAVWAAAGIVHGVENRGSERLVILMGIAPAPG